MNDKTVPHDADEHLNNDEHADNSHIDQDALARKVEGDKKDTPNRDEDEFSKRHLKQPDVETEAEEETKNAADNR